MMILRSGFVVVALASASVLAATSVKADGPARGPYAGPCCAPSWTGFYLGAGVGYGTFVDSLTSVDTATGVPDRPFTDFGGKGWLGTVIVGYDHQIGNVVLGAFADFDWTSAKAAITDETAVVGTTFTVPVFGELEQDHAWAVGARAGMLVSAKTLLYLSGGFTQTKFDGFTLQNASGTRVRSANAQTYDGWFVGAGIETLLSHNLALRLEYRYSDYGHESFDKFIGLPSGGNLSTSHYDTDLTTQTARLVLSYKFGREREAGPLK